jgi:hypothetical protein
MGTELWAGRPRTSGIIWPSLRHKMTRTQAILCKHASRQPDRRPPPLEASSSDVFVSKFWRREGFNALNYTFGATAYHQHALRQVVHNRQGTQKTGC